MGLLHSENTAHGTRIMVWKIEEDIAYFFDRLKLTENDEAFLEGIHPRRALEWAASRLLLRRLTGIAAPFDCLADVNGRPYIPGDSRHISISHSAGAAAVAISDAPIGLDIQADSDTLDRIAPKFARPEELNAIRESSDRRLLQLCWSAKEALFKLYGKGKVDFRRDLLLELPDEALHEGHFIGIIDKDNSPIHCKIQYHFIDNYAFVYAQKINN